MRFRIEVELPGGRSAEFNLDPLTVCWSSYLDDSIRHLEQVTQEARQWIESQRVPSRSPARGYPYPPRRAPVDADEITEPDTYGGLVVHPGDTLIVWTDRPLTAEHADMYRTKLRERLSGLADVVVLNAAGVAAYRPETP